MIKTAIKRPVTVCMLVIAVLVLGFVAYNSLKLAYIPNISVPYAAVITSYSDAGPEEVLELVTKPLEEQLSTLTGVESITSRSSDGRSMVFIEFTSGTDLDEAVNDIRDQLERVRLPDDVDDPSILKIEMDSDSFNIGVTSENMDVSTLYDYVDENITTYFERIEGVASVEIQGGVDTEIQVVLDSEKASLYGVTLSGIASSLSSENQNIAVGELKQGSQDMTLRVAGQFDSIEDIRNVYITTSAGNGLLLKDIAKSIEEVDLDQERISLINGKEGISINVSLSSDGNLVEVSDSITETIEELEESEPNLDFLLLTTTANYIKRSINNVVQTAFQAAIIAVIILLIFLQDWKSAVIIGISIPTSIMATFAGMYLRPDMTMNLVSMSGVVIAIGMLVDNSVVVLENINQWRAKGYSALESAYEGTKEVAMAVFASTLTTVAVFAPFMFWSETMGQILMDIAYTVCVALFASYVVSITFVPTMATILMVNEDRPRIRPKRRTILNSLGDVVNGALNRLDHVYSRFLGLCLRHRFLSFVAVIVIFVLTLSATSGLGMDLMPSSDEGSVSLSASMPDGYDFDYTYEILEEILEAVGDIPEAESTYANASSSSISIEYNLVSSDDRDRSDEDISKMIEEATSDIAGCEISVSQGSMAMGSFGGSGFTLEVKGDDIDTLREISDDLVEKFEEIDGAKNVESSLDSAQLQVDIVVDRAKAASYGISSSSIASAVSAANSGVSNTTLKVDGTETDINVMYPDDELEYVKDLYSLTITTSSGVEIPLTEVADIVETETATTISREDQVTYISLTGEVDGADTSTTQALVQEKLDEYVFPDGYTYSFGGIGEMMSETFNTLYIIIAVAVMLVFIVMASQFESLVQPFVIMFSMPLALTGGLFGLFITGQNLTAFAMMGFLMLVGMVVNNGIVLIDYANQRRLEHGMECYEALVESGRSRLRPILMTTLTTVCGMIPMALALSEGMEIQQGMGIVIIFGLSIGTLVTLVFIPVLYSVIDSLSRRIRRITAKTSPYADAMEDKYSKAVKAYKEKQAQQMQQEQLEQQL
ncbi:MAG: efflux RND transporter permease subunit [Clostridiales bacterium]|nr:efflux RND transporter permease subunit [Clostridiales bacterium]